jgi:hypothetical protein
MRYTFRLFIILLIAIAFGLSLRSAKADTVSIRPGEMRPPGADPAAEIVASISLSNGSPMVGEPLVLTLTVYNYSDREIYLHGLRDSERGDVELELLDKAGQALPPRKHWGGFAQQWPLVAAAIGSRYKLVHRIVINRWVAVERPGSYTLNVRLRLQYSNFGETPRTETPLTNSLQVPVKVARTDWGRLREIAERLHPDNWDNTTDGDNNNVMFDELTSMSGKAASPVWLGLIVKPTYLANPSSLIWRLSNVGDREAISTLAAVWRMAVMEADEVKRLLAVGRYRNTNQELIDSGNEARRALDSLYTHGDPSLKSYVGAIFRTMEGKLPVRPQTPSNIKVQVVDGPPR